MKHRAKRIRAGRYLYRGFEIHCVGYHAPDQKVAWEAVDTDGSGFAHAFSLKMCKKLIDDELNRINKN